MVYVPEGWTYEPADMSVGIFGSLLYHDCDGNTEEDAQEAVEMDGGTNKHDGLVDYITLWRCPVCGATITETETWPDDEEEEEALP